MPGLTGGAGTTEIDTRALLGPGLRTALVHDYLLVMRGAERTFAAIADCWPQAPVHTLLYDKRALQGRFDGHAVRTSYLQRLGVRQEGFRRLMPLLAGAAERMPLDGYDLVVSSSSAFAHGVRPRADAVHVCYCHSPFRYAWFEPERALMEVRSALRPVLRRALARHRRWDRAAARRVTHYIANSQITRERIMDWFGRDAGVVHPPVEVHRFTPSPDGPADFLLVVSELVRHKRVEVALEAARRAGRRIKVVGTGPDEQRLRARYGDHATFLGRVDDEMLAQLYPKAQALVVPNVEEFGITAVESQAAGRPVVAVRHGGACETVLDGETGILVPPGDTDALTEVLRETDFERFDQALASLNAQRFSVESFQAHLVMEIAHVVDSAPALTR
jgi:glycosyltransferase involved in cell wall biosynthesis